MENKKRLSPSLALFAFTARNLTGLIHALITGSRKMFSALKKNLLKGHCTLPTQAHKQS